MAKGPATHPSCSMLHASDSNPDPITPVIICATAVHMFASQLKYSILPISFSNSHIKTTLAHMKMKRKKRKRKKESEFLIHGNFDNPEKQRSLRPWNLYSCKALFYHHN